MSSLIVYGIFLIILLNAFSKISGYSAQFGLLHKAAVPIYEVNEHLIGSEYYMEYVDKGKDDAVKFLINVILVYDKSEPVSPLQTEIIYGGIGFNFTMLRFSCLPSQENPIYLKVVIYGLGLCDNLSLENCQANIRKKGS